MTVYLVTGELTDKNSIWNETRRYVYGVFSTKDQAKAIVEKLEKNAAEYDDEDEEISIEEFTLDKPTEWYDWVMSY